MGIALAQCLLGYIQAEGGQSRPRQRQEKRRRDADGGAHPVVNRNIAPAPPRVFLEFERALGAHQRKSEKDHDEQAGEVDSHVLVVDRRPEARGIYMIEGEGDGDVIEHPRQRRAIVAGDEGRVVLFLKRLGRFDVECAGRLLDHCNSPLVPYPTVT